jgi:hypothetical protein
MRRRELTNIGVVSVITVEIYSGHFFTTNSGERRNIANNSSKVTSLILIDPFPALVKIKPFARAGAKQGRKSQGRGLSWPG